MTQRPEFDKIEVHLIRVLQTLITERSVSRAAMKLQSAQPVVSAQLKRLRALTGDPLLVRAGNGMVPTETALELLAPAPRVAQDARPLVQPRARPARLRADHEHCDLPHRRERLPRPALPPRDRGARQARRPAG